MPVSRPFVGTYYPRTLGWRQLDTATRLSSPYTGSRWMYRQPGSTAWELTLDFPATDPTTAEAVEASLLASWSGTQAPAKFWWPVPLAAPAGTVGNFEVENVEQNGFEITFKPSSLTSGLLSTGQWIVIEGVLYRVISTTVDSGKTWKAFIFPQYRGRIGGLIDWGMTDFAKAPRWEFATLPTLERDEVGNLKPWSLTLIQIPYATYPF